MATTQTITHERITALPNGGFVLTWQELAQAGPRTLFRIKAQFFDAAGNPVSDAIPVNENTVTEIQPHWIGENKLSISIDEQSSVVVFQDPIHVYGYTYDGTPHELDNPSRAPGVSTAAPVLADGREIVNLQMTISNGQAEFDFEIADNRLTGIVIDGTPGDDHYIGTDFRDVMNGKDGSDTLEGWGGRDKLIGGAGADKLAGGDGNDILIGDVKNLKKSSAPVEFGVDLADGGAGNDKMIGDAHAIRQNDIQSGGDFMGGSDGNDLLIGDAVLVSGKNFIAGNDVLYGGNGDDRLYGDVKHARHDYTGGEDVLNGGAGNDWMDGGNGDDELTGGRGSDIMIGGGGADRFVFDADLKTKVIERSEMVTDDEGHVFLTDAGRKLTGHEYLQNRDAYPEDANPWDWSAAEWGQYVLYKTIPRDLIVDVDRIEDFDPTEGDTLDFSALSNLKRRGFREEFERAIAHDPDPAEPLANVINDNDQFNIVISADGSEIRIEYNTDGNTWTNSENVFDAAIILENIDIETGWTWSEIADNLVFA